MITHLGKANVTLSSWNILCVALANGKRAELFIGYSHADGMGRLSTRIKSYSEVLKLGETESGSTYQLIGEPGQPHGDAMYVLEQRLGVSAVQKELFSAEGAGWLSFKYPVNGDESGM